MIPMQDVHCTYVERMEDGKVHVPADQHVTSAPKSKAYTRSGLSPCAAAQPQESSSNLYGSNLSNSKQGYLSTLQL